jgi:hypothetical protein
VFVCQHVVACCVTPAVRSVLFSFKVLWFTLCGEPFAVLVAGIARTGRFIPEETKYRNHCTEGWLGLGFSLNVLRKRTPDVPAGYRSRVLTVNSQYCSIQQ